MEGGGRKYAFTHFICVHFHQIQCIHTMALVGGIGVGGRKYASPQTIGGVESGCNPLGKPHKMDRIGARLEGHQKTNYPLRNLNASLQSLIFNNLRTRLNGDIYRSMYRFIANRIS